MSKCVEIQNQGNPKVISLDIVAKLSKRRIPNSNLSKDFFFLGAIFEQRLKESLFTQVHIQPDDLTADMQ